MMIIGNLEKLEKNLTGKVDMNTYDNKNLYFTNLQSFADTLRTRESRTERLLVNTREIFFRPSNLEAGKVSLQIKNKIYSVADSAFVSIRGRIELNGAGLLKLPVSLLVQVLNDRIKDLNNVRVIIIEDKVRAILTTQYKVIPCIDIIQKTLQGITEKLGTYDFKCANVSYDILKMLLLFSEKKKVIQEIYNITNETYVPGLYLATSDTGFSANKVIPLWHTPKGILPLSYEGINMQHRGKNSSLENFVEDLPQLFVKFRNSMKLIKKQLTSIVDDPEKRVETLGKKFKLPQKDVRRLNEKLDLLLLTQHQINSYQITQLFIELAREEENESKKEFLEIIAGRVLYS